MTSMTAKFDKQSEFKKGIQAALSIALGYMPVALTYGLLAKTTGLNFYETMMMSILVYAGAAQYIALNLIAIGTGVFEIIFTIFVVNIRHFLMSASLSGKVENDRRAMKALYAFWITDETFALTATRKGILSTGFMLGVCVVAYVSWVVFSGFGYAVGSVLPDVLQQSMGIALYAMFIGLLVPSLKKSRKVLYLAVMAAIMNSAFSLLLSTGWAIILATLISSFVVEWFWKGEKKDA
mgnify:CR=1 FL=1